MGTVTNFRSSFQRGYRSNRPWTNAEMFAGFGIMAIWLGAFALGVLFWWPLLAYSWSYWFG